MISRRALRLSLVAALLLSGAVAGVAWWFASTLIASANRPVSMPLDFPAIPVSIPGDARSVAGSWRDLGADSPAVLLLHGIRGDRTSMLARARRLVDAGFSVLLIDLQAHGETPGGQITLGWRESADVRAARDWLRLQAPGRRIGVVGVSLGGASVLLGAQPAGFDAVVLEAVYPRIARAVRNRIDIRLRPLGRVIAPLLLVQLEPRLRVKSEQLEPIRNVGRLGAPVLIVGGSLDAHTTEPETRELFAAAREPKELWIVDGAGHQDFSRFDPAAYDAHVVAFLRRELVETKSSRAD